jgi:hypothetical protein
MGTYIWIPNILLINMNQFCDWTLVTYTCLHRTDDPPMDAVYSSRGSVMNNNGQAYTEYTGIQRQFLWLEKR